MTKKKLLLVLLMCSMISGCGLFWGGPKGNAATCPPGLCRNPFGQVLYGEDNRLDMYNVKHVGVRENALAVGSLWYGYQLRKMGDIYELMTDNYGSMYNLSPKEPFRNQPSGPFCTVFLVAPDVVVTAGHCINFGNFRTRRVVFGFNMIDKRNCKTLVNKKDVYKIREVIAHSLSDTGLDYAVIRLDRKVDHILPLRVSSKEVKKGDWLYVLGHPCGLPLKYAPCARVLSASNDLYFKASLDTYGGNSGSPVFNNDGEVVGILVRGETDFINTPEGKVSRQGLFGESCIKTVHWKKYIK